MRTETDKAVAFYFPDDDRGAVAYKRVTNGDESDDSYTTPDIQFQHGPVGDNGINGIQNEELLEVMLLRLRHLNETFPCRENALAITNIEQGLMWLRRRTQLRVEQGVEGKNLPHQS